MPHSAETLAAWRAIIAEVLGPTAEGVVALDWWTDAPMTAAEACFKEVASHAWMDAAFVGWTAKALKDDIKKQLPDWNGFGLRYPITEAHTRQLAIAAWNTRQPAPSVKEKL